MLHILFGEDDYSIRQALQEIKKALGDPTALMTNTITLDGRNLALDELRNACETVPFLADKRLVVVEGLLSRYEAPGRTNNRRKTKKAEKPDESAAIAGYVKSIPEFTELVFIDGKIGSKNPLLNGISGVGKAKSFPMLREPELRQWVERRVKKVGGSIAPGAVSLLVRYVGNNLWIMAGEVDKLAMFVPGRPITDADVRSLVSYTQEGNIFAMVDAILEFRGGVAQGLLEHLLQQGAAPVHLLFMIARQVRLMYRVRDLRKQGVARGEMQSRLGLTSDFVFRKVWEQADKYTPARLREVYHRLLEADLSIKTGRCEGELALSILVAELGQREVRA